MIIRSPRQAFLLHHLIIILFLGGLVVMGTFSSNSTVSEMKMKDFTAPALLPNHFRGKMLS